MRFNTAKSLSTPAGKPLQLLESWKERKIHASWFGSSRLTSLRGMITLHREPSWLAKQM